MIRRKAFSDASEGDAGFTKLFPTRAPVAQDAQVDDDIPF
jgi:hypothetical protein